MKAKRDGIKSLDTRPTNPAMVTKMRRPQESEAGMKEGMNDDRYDGKYWICSECAKKKGWKEPDHAVTQMMGKCGWCKIGIETVLTPVVDFSGPGKKAIWD